MHIGKNNGNRREDHWIRLVRTQIKLQSTYGEFESQKKTEIYEKATTKMFQKKGILLPSRRVVESVNLEGR
jgi:hypothetical protein